MIRIRQMRMVSYIAVMLLFTMYILPAACFAKGSHQPALPVRSIVVFPFENTTEISLDKAGQDMPVCIQGNLSATGVYRAYAYNERIPSIQRAVREVPLKQEDVEGPFGAGKDGVAKAIRLAKEMSADFALVGTIEDTKVDVAKSIASVTMSACIVDVKTGDTVKTIAVTGNVLTGTKSNEAELIAGATNDAVTKMVKEIAPNPVPGNQQVVSRKKTSWTKKLFIPILLGVAVGIIASSNHGGNSNNADTDLPPTPY